jgi:hypothetical protein
MSHTLAAPNQALEPTPNSVRSCVAPAIGRGSPQAFGGDHDGRVGRYAVEPTKLYACDYSETVK